MKKLFIPLLFMMLISITSLTVSCKKEKIAVVPEPTILSASATIDFEIVPPNKALVKTITVPGATIGDVVALGLIWDVFAGIGPFILGTETFTAWVSAPNTVSVICANHDPIEPINPPAAVFKVKVFK